jgi:hypothetical protein
MSSVESVAMKEDPTAADTVSSPIKNFPLDTVIDPRQKEYQIRRRNRRLGWSMDQLKNGCKGLIAANTEETFDDDDKQLIADTAFWAEKLLKEVEMMEKCVRWETYTPSSCRPKRITIRRYFTLKVEYILLAVGHSLR